MNDYPAKQQFYKTAYTLNDECVAVRWLGEALNDKTNKFEDAYRINEGYGEDSVKFASELKDFVL